VKKQNIIFCTYFNKNYLFKGLALHASLLKHNPWVKIWILCMDTYTKNILDSMKLKGVTTISLVNFEDKELLKAKKTRSLVEYYWTCTPSLPLFIFNNCLQVEKVVYLDADLYFYSSINPAFEELGNKSILTVESRYPKGQEIRIKTSGRFNVGFQIFNRDKESLMCLKRWRKQCLKWCYWRLEDGKLGDQLYLNEWPRLYKNLVISQNLGINAAPWNISQYKICEKDRNVYLNDDKLICYHFHQYDIINENNFEYSSGYRLSKDLIKYVYKTYEIEIKRQIKFIKSIDEDFKIVPHKKNIKENIRGRLIKLFGPIYWDLLSILR